MAHDDQERVPALPIDPDLAPSGLAGGRRRAEVLPAIAAGGALGALARYAVAERFGTVADGFPWATFGTNVVGSLLLGLVLVLVVERFPPSRFIRPFVATGFLGAFTTYSTFAVETDLLVSHGKAGTAAAYVIASLAVGLAAVVVGMAGARALPVGRRPR